MVHQDIDCLVLCVSTALIHGSYLRLNRVNICHWHISFSMNELGSWDHCLDGIDDVGLLISELAIGLLHSDRVTMSILVLHVIWRTKNDESTIDHYSDLVAQLFSFVHAMGCK